MLKKMTMSLLAASIATLAAGQVQAAFIDAPVPTNAYITFNGMDWAWGSPCAPTPGFSCDGSAGSYLAYQGALGWRLPTVTELAARPSASDFLFAGANVPAGGVDPVSGATMGSPGAGACATAYFSSVFRHCDFNDGVAMDIHGITNGASSETWFVRTSAAVAAVPEPTTWAMMALGMGAVGFSMRRRKATTKVTYA